MKGMAMKMFNLLKTGLLIFAVASVLAYAGSGTVVENSGPEAISVHSFDGRQDNTSVDFNCLSAKDNDKEKDKKIDKDSDRRKFRDRDDDEELDDLFDLLDLLRIGRRFG